MVDLIFTDRPTSVSSAEVISITDIFDRLVNVQEEQKTKYSQRDIFECFEHLCRFVNTLPKNAALRVFVIYLLSGASK